jgi:predicted phage-related endonuclease
VSKDLATPCYTGEAVRESSLFRRSKVLTLRTQREETCWPRLRGLGLDDAAVERRRRYIGGSDANVILSGSPDLVLRLWREKRGAQEPEDLSARLPVMLGCWTEAFNRQWYEERTGTAVSNVGLWIRSAIHPWRACTLDGYVSALGAVWEAKHCSGFSKPDEVLSRYMPQLQHNMSVAGADRAVMSVIFGNSKWEIFEVAADWLYQEELLGAEERFWEAVQNGEPPVAIPPPAAAKPVGVREVCLEGNNAWAAAAADWLKHKDAARRHADAVVSLKGMVEEDASRAFGHGVEARRSKAGALSIREMKG